MTSVIANVDSEHFLVILVTSKSDGLEVQVNSVSNTSCCMCRMKEGEHIRDSDGLVNWLTSDTNWSSSLYKGGVDPLQLQ